MTYRLLKSEVEFSGYQTSGSTQLQSHSGVQESSTLIREPVGFPFPFRIPTHLEVWMSPLSREGMGGYHLSVQVVAEMPDGNLSVLKTDLDENGSAVFQFISPLGYHDATSPSMGQGKGYTCIWEVKSEVKSEVKVQFNRNLRDFVESTRLVPLRKVRASVSPSVCAPNLAKKPSYLFFTTS